MKHYQDTRKFSQLTIVACCSVILAVGGIMVWAQQQRARRVAAESQGTPVPKTINVGARGDLQAALDAARPGDTVMLTTGATYTGSFVLPNKGASNEYITIRSSRAAELAEGVRVNPANSNLMARIVTPGGGRSALKTAPGAHHYRLVGLEVTQRDANAESFDLIALGDGSEAQSKIEQVPHHIVMDRCFIHGDKDTGVKRCVALNSAATEITNSYISDCKSKTQDAQAVCGWNGAGPFVISNNYLEGSGENVLFGGADASIPNLVPSDIEIKRNHFSKPRAWKGIWFVKNLLELKNAQRVRIDGNLFENNWEDQQKGHAILFTPRNQGGKNPWAIVQDVEFTNNVMRDVTAGISLLGEDDINRSRPTNRITIKNNLFYRIERGFLITTGIEGLRIEHNTILDFSDKLIWAHGSPSSNFIFRDNIAQHDPEGGIYGQGHGIGNVAMPIFFPGGTVRGNVFAGVKESGEAWLNTYPAGNFYVVATSRIGMVDFTGGTDPFRNFRLTPSSRFKNRATDGKDPGGDFDQLAAALKFNLASLTQAQHR